MSSPMLSSATERHCNPSLLGIIGLNSTSTGQQDGPVQWWDAQGIVGLILFLLCVLYSRYADIAAPSSSWEL